MKPGDIVRLRRGLGFRRVVSIDGETAITEGCDPCGLVSDPDQRPNHVMELIDAKAEWDAIEARSRFVAEAQASRSEIVPSPMIDPGVMGGYNRAARDYERRDNVPR